jgi:hypothetical protein
MVLRFNRGVNSLIGTECLVVGDDDWHIGGTSNPSFLTTFNPKSQVGQQVNSLGRFVCMKRYMFESLVLF